MAASISYPFIHHPCFAGDRKSLWARIHLPVARLCNVKCIFCDHTHGSSCHTSKPGYAANIMSPEQAIARTRQEITSEPQLRIVAISGPGEPLANEETFRTFAGIRNKRGDLRFCLSTNGVLLEDSAERLKELDVETISVSVNAAFPETAARIYQWATINQVTLKGHKMGKVIISKQLGGIRKAVDLDITVKVNTVLIPDINLDDIEGISRNVSEAGAELQNIVPLVVEKTESNLRSPTTEEIWKARRLASVHIPQFIHCQQCRSDVVGVPGKDRIL